MVIISWAREFAAKVVSRAGLPEQQKAKRSRSAKLRRYFRLKKVYKIGFMQLFEAPSLRVSFGLVPFGSVWFGLVSFGLGW